MKRNTLMKILALSLVIGGSHANTLTVMNQKGTTSWTGVTSTSGGGDEQQKPAPLDLPGVADREKPMPLMAPGGCAHCISPDSSWQQFRFAMSLLYWI